MMTSLNLLDKIYTDLEYDQGDLVNIAQNNLGIQHQIDIGEWIDSCKKINRKSSNFNIEAMFFVKDNPVIVFGICQSSESDDINDAYINVWNIARPKYFFLSTPGELKIYDLSIPISMDGGKTSIPKPIELIKTANYVLDKLSDFSRENIEAGNLKFEASSKNYRADRTLISDIKKIRVELIKLGLNDNNLKYAHSIIGRSIFIRYLEDRGILTNEYFSVLASQNKSWKENLETPIDNCFVISDEMKVSYIKSLRNKDFTYTLFRKLSEDFNGDMFPIDEHEEKAVTAEHLFKISEFLQGKFDEQMRLFFWAYKFDVIPMELMSNLYEEFYHKQTSNDKDGTHYTPLSLVEFVVKQALPLHVLESKPIVLDPCCGSGIFIVEAFKRIVRYNILKNNGNALDYEQLKTILRDQLLGIELKEDALRVAAFSLYVAFLDFQEPPCILEQIKKGKLLPNLKCNDTNASLNTLLCADAFSNKASNFINDKSIDVIIGNPPWGKADITALRWCKENHLPIGDQEYSQAFIWRTIRWTQDNGAICLLLPLSVLSKSSAQSKQFKNEWFSSVEVIQIVNFTHSRRVFFQKSIAPFMSVLFKINTPNSNSYISYWSIKKCSMNIEHQYIVLNKSDMHFIKQHQFLEEEHAWKVLWWGGLADLSLIRKLKSNSDLSSLIDAGIASIKQGFTPGKGETKIIDRLSKYKVLSLKNLVSYGSINNFLTNDVPTELHRNFSSFELFEGDRILLKRGITGAGKIISRVENMPFSFNYSVHCMKFLVNDTTLLNSIGAILLSSLAKYYFFLTSSDWGMWHDEIRLCELKQLPLPDISECENTKKLGILMEEVKLCENFALDSLALLCNRDFDSIIKDIDNVVFEMYKLTEDEKSLIIDMCTYGLDLFYNKTFSYALNPLPHLSDMFYGTEKSLLENDHIIYGYLRRIISVLNRQLTRIDAELEWRIYRSKGIISIVFLTKYINDCAGTDFEDTDDWKTALTEFTKLSKQKITDEIYIDGSFIGVSENCIVIVKKDELRHWSVSAAVKDLNSILFKLFNNQPMEVNENE
jgi:type I restriction-modification system DNA methylase subunit